MKTRIGATHSIWLLLAWGLSDRFLAVFRNPATESIGLLIISLLVAILFWLSQGGASNDQN